MTAPLIRPMREADVEAFGEITATSYYEVDARTYQRAWPDPVRRPPGRNGAWINRARAALATDPGGCWVAEVDGEVVGGAVSRVRELMWILASFAVRPDLQGRGIGTQLMAAAMHHGRGCLRGMFAASADPGAVRRYRLAGFDLHPQMLLAGVVDRSAIPVVDRVREGTAADFDLLDSVDRRTRGAAHLSDHELLLAQFRLVDVDVARPRRVVGDDEAELGEQISVRHITAANAWALAVGLAARMAIHQNGYLCLRQMSPPTPYLHHGSLL